ncbi:Sporulation kinase D [Rosistilla ulvae]|uniref:histidine kinase n=2 Tax=Rosistilla ulvae TaxID=1930277 RepID=A0A517LUB9_9BACT|nr:Sporulation kinase D [Rosistilla ulvae]
MNQTGLLPSISWNSSRWWLPLSTATANQLAQQFLQPTSDALRALLESDPALRIWMLLESAASNNAALLTLSNLANQAPAALAAAFRDSDRRSDPPSDLQSFHPQWCELHRDATAWDSPERWLQVTGPAAPSAWQQTWPRLVDATNLPQTCPDFGGNKLDLARLLQTIDRAAATNAHFDNALNTEKLAALKEFAYGLSHEINNPLANISTRAQSLARDESSPDRKRMLAAIVNQAMRAYEMIADAMFFANPPQPKIADDSDPEDVSELVRQIVDEFTASSAIDGIAISSQIAPDCRATIDRGQIADAIRSLLRNACEAIHPPGQIAIELVRADKILRLRVTDSGPGLNERERRHAFDPFFSGREAGRGLGLGLCKAQRVIELAGGQIAIDSSPTGCVATVHIPAATQ